MKNNRRIKSYNFTPHSFSFFVFPSCDMASNAKFCPICAANGSPNVPANSRVGDERKAYLCVFHHKEFHREREVVKSDTATILHVTKGQLVYDGGMGEEGLFRSLRILSREIEMRRRMDTTIFDTVPVRAGKCDRHGRWHHALVHVRSEITLVLGAADSVHPKDRSDFLRNKMERLVAAQFNL